MRLIHIFIPCLPLIIVFSLSSSISFLTDHSGMDSVGQEYKKDINIYIGKLCGNITEWQNRHPLPPGATVSR